MRRRRISALLLALSLCLCAAGGAVWAMPKASVTNHFSAGYVDIALDAETGEHEVLPGTEVESPAVITCEGYSCYVRAKAAFSGSGGLDASDLYGIPEGWVEAGGYYYYTEPLENSEEVCFFSGVAIPSGLSGGEAGDTFRVTVTAEAVQSENISPDFTSEAPWGEVNIQECTSEGIYTAESSGEVQSFAIEYRGSAYQLITDGDDFFQNFPVLMPGDAYSDSFTVFNDCDEEITLYFASLTPEDGEESELLDETRLAVTCTADGQTETVLSGSCRGSGQADSLSEMQAIAVIPAGGTAVFDFTLSLPVTADNTYASLDGAVEWVFAVDTETASDGSGTEISGSEGTAVTDGPQTGDTGSAAPALFTLGGAAAVSALAVRGWKRTGKA